MTYNPLNYSDEQPKGQELVGKLVMVRTEHFPHTYYIGHILDYNAKENVYTIADELTQRAVDLGGDDGLQYEYAFVPKISAGAKTETAAKPKTDTKK
jgi:hypothetical protein